LHDLGFDTAALQQTFRVHGYEGPLLDGEVEHAVAWVTANATPLDANTERAA
jgi:hypothetical protein